jgi:cardiolipin synthase
MLDAIRRAKTRINFESYSSLATWARFSRKSWSPQASAASPSEWCSMPSACRIPPKRLKARIEDAGGHLVWFNGLGTWTIEKTNYRTHRKLLVVDGSVAFTGGAGVGDHWKGNADAEEHWRDTQFRITGPSVEILEAAFFENWTESGGDAAPIFDPPDPGHGPPAPAITVWSNASEGVNDVKLMYLYTIASARRTLDIESPYVVLDSSMRLAIQDAMKRGVRVRVLTDGQITDAKPVKYASRHEYDRLMSSGGRLYEYQPTMMHAKVMVADGAVSVIGTANLDNRSLELNDEVAIAVVDPDLAGRLTSSFESDLARSRTWTLAEWRDRSILSKVRERFWSLFAETF